MSPSARKATRWVRPAEVPKGERSESKLRCDQGAFWMTCPGFVVSAEGDSQESNGHSINENVLIEIGAAFVIYERRVILLWDKRLPVPSNLQGLYRCEYEGDQLSWDAGTNLMKALQQFKK